MVRSSPTPALRQLFYACERPALLACQPGGALCFTSLFVKVFGWRSPMSTGGPPCRARRCVQSLAKAPRRFAANMCGRRALPGVIERVELFPVRLPYARTMVWASSQESSADFMILRLTTSDGVAGVSEEVVKTAWTGATLRTLALAFDGVFPRRCCSGSIRRGKGRFQRSRRSARTISPRR